MGTAVDRFAADDKLLLTNLSKLALPRDVLPASLKD